MSDDKNVIKPPIVLSPAQSDELFRDALKAPKLCLVTLPDGSQIIRSAAKDQERDNG